MISLRYLGFLEKGIAFIVFQFFRKMGRTNVAVRLFCG